jgi:LytS/YehU family sensor histidine kinase
MSQSIKRLVRILSHLLFWLFWIGLYWYQNDQLEIRQFTYWLIILLVLATVIYVNLYVLFPLLFFKKRTIHYFIYIVGLILFGSTVIFLIIPDNSSLYLPFGQNVLNVSFFVLISSTLKILTEYLNKQNLLMDAETRQVKTELSLLKSQVNPHFLFNTLNNLYGLIVQKENEKAAELILKLSDLMRYLLESSKAEKVSLRKEIKFLEDYLLLERVRLSPQVDIRLEVAGMEHDLQVAPLLFIPMVENAFKHGLQSISISSFAHFSLSVQGTDLYFEAHNSVGASATHETKSGTGLQNLQKRLELLYPGKHQLVVDTGNFHFKITMHLQL